MQTSIPAGGQSIGVAGQIADSGPHDIVSGFNEGLPQMPFGVGLRQGAAADGYLLPTGFSVVHPIQGVNVFDYNHSRAGAADSQGRYAGDLGGSGLLQYSSLQVMRKGRVFAHVEQAVRLNERPWCRGIATGTKTEGMFAGTNLGGSYHVDCTKQGVFRTASYTAADGTTLVAVLECDFSRSAT